MKNVLFLLLIVVLFGCNTKDNTHQTKNKPAEKIAKNEYPKIINIGSDFKNIKEFRLSDIADDIEYVKLEKTHESLVGGGIPSWYITKEYILIFSKGRLLQFTRTGNFIRQIGRNGRGPGEFISIKGMVLNESNKTFYVIANYTHKVLKYNIKTGEFLGDFPINDYLGSSMYKSAFCLIGNDTFAAISNPGYQFQSDYILLEIFDGKGNVLTKIKSTLYSFQDNKNIKRVKQAANQIWCFKDKFRLYEGFNDTIYNLNNNYQLEPAYVFDLGKYKGPFEKMTTKYYYELPNYIQMNGFWETQDNLFFNFIYKGKFCLGQFNKKEGNFYWQDVPVDEKIGFFLNDIDGGLPFLPQLQIDNSENEISYCLNAIEMKQQLTDEYFENSIAKFPEKKEKLKRFVDELSVDDNPVLMLVKLKE